MPDRIENEIIQGKYLVSNNPAKIWNWGSSAGIVRKQRRVNMLSQLITSNMTVLEVGCGSGEFTKEFQKTQADIFAIDVSPELLDFAKRSITATNVHFQLQNAFKMNFENNKFDAVIGSSVLHHLDVKSALTEFSRVLKPGGIIAFTEPNMLNPHIFIERKFRFLFKHVTPDETAFIKFSIQKLLEKSGFEAVKIFSFDWLHPIIPSALIPVVKRLGSIAESLPLVKEFSGSLYIYAKKKQ